MCKCCVHLTRLVASDTLSSQVPKSPWLTNRRHCCGLSAVIFSGTFRRMLPAIMLANHKYLIITAFSAVCHNNMVSCCVHSEPPDLLVSHKLASQVES